MRIFLDWPAPEICGNTRAHWGVKARLKKDAKLSGLVCTREAMDEQGGLDPTKQYKMHLLFCPPDKRRRDLDNVETGMKAAFDGMAQALGIDDSQIKHSGKDWGDVFKKKGVVIVEIEEVKE